MPTLDDARFPVPDSWSEFENICKSAFSQRWSNPNLTRHGRQGQEQHGVDIYGDDHILNLVGIQCKNTFKQITQKVILEECDNAEKFTPPITTLYIATTTQRDVHIQQFVRNLTVNRKAQNKFPVEVVFWSDITSDLARSPELARKHFPQFFQGTQQSTAEIQRKKDASTLYQILTFIDFTTTYDELQNGAKYIPLLIESQLIKVKDYMNQPSFGFYDSSVLKAVQDLINSWEALLNLVRNAPYRYIEHMKTYSFSMPGDRCRNREEEDLYEAIEVKIAEFSKAMKTFCGFVNSNFHGIDINETNAVAYNKNSR